MGNAGHPRSRLRRALERGSLTTVLAAAAEVERLDLDEALAVCARVARDDPENFPRYAVRWVGLLVERRPSTTLLELRAATDALIDLGVDQSLAAARERLNLR